MKFPRIWIAGAAVILGIWLLAFCGMSLARGRRMTAEKVITRLAAHPLQSATEIDRLRIIEETAQRINHLDFEERQKLRFGGEIRRFYQEMTDAERSHYLDLTLPGGMKQMMEAFNNMSPEGRKRVITRAMNELARLQDEANREDLEQTFGEQNLKRIMNEGFKSYFRDASASAKLDIQPLLEQIQLLRQMNR